MSNKLKSMSRRIDKSVLKNGIDTSKTILTTENDINDQSADNFIKEALKKDPNATLTDSKYVYVCDKCAEEIDMYLELGVEGMFKVMPAPFSIKCPLCNNGIMQHKLDKVNPLLSEMIVVDKETMSYFALDQTLQHGRPEFSPDVLAKSKITPEQAIASCKKNIQTYSSHINYLKTGQTTGYASDGIGRSVAATEKIATLEYLLEREQLKYDALISK